MNVIDQALTNVNVRNKPNVLWRCVDDIFVAFNDKSTLNIFFTALNNVYSSITFTKNWTAATILFIWMFL